MTVSGETGLKQSDIGKIPEDWGTISFVKAISNVVDNRGKTAPTSKSGIALIATNCIKENALYPVKEKIRYVSKETYENWFRDHPKPDDIIIVNKGTPGLVCLVPNPVDFVIAQDMVAVRPDKSKIYGRFLFAFMRSKVFKHEVDSLNVGTTIPHLKKTYFPLLIVPLPSKYEQIVIGDFYYDLSKKIELNLKMNETLEAIGQAVFKHWFVDFEFPNKEGKPYKSSGGEMVDSELGEIPKDWTVSTVADVAQITLGGTPKRSESQYWNGNILWATAGTIANSSNLYVFETDEKITDEGVINSNAKILPEETIVVTARGTVGELRLMGVPISVNQTCYALSPKHEMHPYFLYCLLKSSLNQLKSLSYGTVFQTITLKTFDEFAVIKPSPEVIRDFNTQVKPLFNRMKICTKENIILSKIRDNLLPKLMSGKIRVPIQKETMEIQ